MSHTCCQCSLSSHSWSSVKYSCAVGERPGRTGSGKDQDSISWSMYWKNTHVACANQSSPKTGSNRQPSTQSPFFSFSRPHTFTTKKKKKDRQENRKDMSLVIIFGCIRGIGSIKVWFGGMLEYRGGFALRATPRKKTQLAGKSEHYIKEKEMKI